MAQLDQKKRWFLLDDQNEDYAATIAAIQALTEAHGETYTNVAGNVANTRVVYGYMTAAELAAASPSLTIGAASVLDRMDYTRSVNVQARGDTALECSLRTNDWGDTHPVFGGKFLAEPEEIPSTGVDRLVAHWTSGGETVCYVARSSAGTGDGSTYANRAKIADLISYDGLGNSAISTLTKTILVFCGDLYRFYNEGHAVNTGAVGIEIKTGTALSPTIILGHPADPPKIIYGRPLGANAGGEAADWVDRTGKWSIDIGPSVLDTTEIEEQQFAATNAGGTFRPLTHAETLAACVAGTDQYFLPFRRRGHRNATRTYVAGDRIVFKNWHFICFAGHTDEAPPEPTGGEINAGVPQKNSYWAQRAVWAWDSGRSYPTGDQVLVGGTNYICVQAHSNQTPPNATYWAPFRDLAIWDSGTTYDEGETALTTVTLGSDPFAYTDSSATVTVTHSSHGMTTGTIVYFAGATTFGGISTAVIHDTDGYPITVLDSDSYTVVLSAATGTGSGGGASATVSAHWLCTASNTNQTPPNASYWSTTHRVYANLADDSNPRGTAFFQQVLVPGIAIYTSSRPKYCHVFGVDFRLGGSGDYNTGWRFYGCHFSLGCGFGNQGGLVVEGTGELLYQSLAQRPDGRQWIGCECEYANAFVYDAVTSNAIPVNTRIADNYIHHLNRPYIYGAINFSSADAHSVATQGCDQFVVYNNRVQYTGSQQMTFYITGTGDVTDPVVSGLDETEGILDGWGWPDDTIDNGDGTITYGGRCRGTVVQKNWINDFDNEDTDGNFYRTGTIQDRGIAMDGDAPMIGINGQYDDNVISENLLEGTMGKWNNGAIRPKHSYADDTGAILEVKKNVIRGAAWGLRCFSTAGAGGLVYDPSINFHDNSVSVEDNASVTGQFVILGATSNPDRHRQDLYNNWYTGTGTWAGAGGTRSSLATFQGDAPSGDIYETDSLHTAVHVSAGTATVSITGTVSVGNTLTATPSGTRYNQFYRWLRDGAEIPGATSSTYVCTAKDEDAEITVRMFYQDIDLPGRATAWNMATSEAAEHDDTLPPSPPPPPPSAEPPSGGGGSSSPWNKQPLPSLAHVKRLLKMRKQDMPHEIERQAEVIEAVAVAIETRPAPEPPPEEPIIRPPSHELQATVAMLQKHIAQVQVAMMRAENDIRRAALARYETAVRDLREAVRKRADEEEEEQLVTLIASIL